MRKPTVRLTGRGLALLILGILLVVGGALIGEPDITWIGFLLAGLPVLSLLLLVLVLRPRLRLERSVSPSQVAVGGRPRATLGLRNKRPLAMTAVEFRDQTPAAMGTDARFTIARGLGRWHQPVGYDIHARQRGHFRLGPMRAKSYDPLGLSSFAWQVRCDDTSLRVTPRIWELDHLRANVGAGSAGEAATQRIGQAGQDDVLVREHRHGDDLRRVHWRMTAKQGELMVRLEEHPWDPAMALVVDNRASAHFGHGPEGSLEWCISMAASIATELIANRYRLHIVGADGSVLAPGQGDVHASQERMVDALTDLSISPEPDLRDGLADREAFGTTQSLLAVTGMLAAADASAMAAVGVRMVQCSAIVPDAGAWAAAPETANAHADAIRLLEGNGWTIQHYAPAQTVPDVWRALLARRAAR